MLTKGYTFADLQITDRIGRGGFGMTYKAKDLNLGCTVALKQYLPDQLAGWGNGRVVIEPEYADQWEAGLRDFGKEAQTLASLSSPNIVGVKRWIEAHGTAYIVMDFVEGPSLGKWFRETVQTDDSSAVLSQPEFDYLLPPILNALEKLHKKGIIHRDIKPDNIMLTKAGDPVLIDFGAARVAAFQRSNDLQRIVAHGYSPPELYHSAHLPGAWNDIYSLSAVVYKLLTGDTLTRAPNRLQRDDVRLEQMPEYRKAFIEGIMDGLDLNPETRPKSIAVWREKLMAEDPRNDPKPPRGLINRVLALIGMRRD